MTERLYVVVSGPPAAGKSTLAPLIAEHFGLPLIAKDRIKDALMMASPPADVEASRRLGRAAMAVLYAVAADAPRGAILESAFYRSRAVRDLRALSGTLVEIFCRCDADVAARRYRERANTRLAGHFDGERTDDELRHPEVTEPVGGGWPVLEVDTNEPVDVSALMRRIAAARV